MSALRRLARLLSGPLLAGLLLAGPARAEEPSCADPRSAAQSLLDSLQPERHDPVAAARCLDLSEKNAERGPELAVRLKKVLDARGLYVPVDEIPSEPDHVGDDGRPRITPLPTFPLLVIEKVDGRWVYSQKLVDATDRLYAETFSGLSRRVQDAIPPALEGHVLGLRTWQLVYLGLLVLGAFLAGRLVQHVLVGQLVRAARRVGIDLHAAWLARTQSPISWCVVAGVVRWGIPDLQLGVQSARGLLVLANTALSLAAVIVLVRLVDIGADFLAQRAAATESKLDDQLIPMVTRLAKIAVWALGLVFILQTSGVNVLSLVAGLGIGGLAVALAAKDTVENLFGSLTIFTDKPFQIGDWVVVDGKVEGVVEEVGFRSTRVRTFYNSVVSVPNGRVAAATVDNYGLRARRRVVTTLGVTYNTPRAKIDAFVQAIRAHLEAHPKVFKGTLEVHFSGFGASALEVMVYFFLEVPTWHEELEERGRIYMEFVRIAEELGVSFAFPSTSLYVEKLPDALRREFENEDRPSA